MEGFIIYYQDLKANRCDVTFMGEPDTNVDLKPSQLLYSILLLFMHTYPDRDAYSIQVGTYDEFCDIKSTIDDHYNEKSM